jgi:hypothetical protein
MLRKPVPPKHGGLGMPRRRAEKVAIPMTGDGPQPKKWPNAVRWYAGDDGPKKQWVPGFIVRGKLSEGWVLEGSPEEEAQKRSFGIRHWNRWHYDDSGCFKIKDSFDGSVGESPGEGYIDAASPKGDAMRAECKRVREWIEEGQYEQYKDADVELAFSQPDGFFAIDRIEGYKTWHFFLSGYAPLRHVDTGLPAMPRAKAAPRLRHWAATRKADALRDMTDRDDC